MTDLLDMKQITVILISTLLGAAAGFGMSYIFLNGQIQSLQQNVTNLRGTVGKISDVAVNMSNTIESVVDTLAAGLSAVSEYASTRVDQLQTELDELNSTTQNLNSTIQEIGQGRWHDVAHDTRGPDLPTEDQHQTDPFTLESNKIQISWTMRGRSANATIHIQIHHSDGSVYMILASSGYYGTYVNEITLPELGEYFLKIYTTNVDQWSVTIRDYY